MPKARRSSFEALGRKTVVCRALRPQKTLIVTLVDGEGPRVLDLKPGSRVPTGE